MKSKILVKGAITGFLVAVMGNIIFTTIQEVYFISEFGWLTIRLFLTFFGGLGLITIPSLLFGLLLANILYEDLLQKRLKVPNAIIRGGVLGFIAAIEMCSVALIVFKNATINILLWYIIEAFSLATLCGAYVGKNLAKFILKMKPDLQSG